MLQYCTGQVKEDERPRQKVGGEREISVFWVPFLTTRKMLGKQSEILRHILDSG